MKEFHLGDVLTITTSKLVSTRHMDGVYDILKYVTGTNLFSHQIPKAMEDCKLHLLEQHPKLQNVSAENLNTENWKEWLDKQIELYGKTLPVKPI